VVEDLLEQEQVGGAGVPLIRLGEALLEAGGQQVEVVLAVAEELPEGWLLVCNLLDAPQGQLHDLGRRVGPEDLLHDSLRPVVSDEMLAILTPALE
jgi:hypothetical protein